MVVAEDDEVLVLDKPPKLPMHPSGAYHFNSLSLLAAAHRPGVALHIVHRLDRLTSGLSILAKVGRRVECSL